MGQSQEGVGYIPSVMPRLTNNSRLDVRQQIDDHNHDMVKMFTQQIGIMFNPLIQNTNLSYQQWAHQMSRIVDFFGAPYALI